MDQSRTVTSDPLVSVIIPANNAAATITETIRSALAQTYRNIEVIVADDGSTDETARLAAAAAEGDRRLRLVCHHRRTGPAAARNRAIAAASGDYVALLDADDLWHSSKIERQLAVALAPPRPALVYCYCRRIDGAGRVVGHLDCCAIDGPAFARHLYTNFVGASSALIRRDVLIAVGGYEERLERSEDFITQVRVAALGEVGVVPSFLSAYRKAAAMTQSSDQDAMFVCWTQAQAMLDKEMPGLPRQPVRWAEAKRLLHLAEHRLYSRRFVAAIQPLGRALWRDPVRSILYALHILTKRKEGGDPEGVPFACVDPEDGVETAFLDRVGRRSLLGRLEAARFERLRLLDLKGGRAMY